jgi:thiamine pyrophosphate-dependent acetolactate synthase large subunit-like protein
VTVEVRLCRRQAVARLLRDRGDLLVVSGLGSPTYDVAAAGDHPRNFYLWGAMGGAAMVGLGLAVAQPSLPVVVITGDGEMLMGLGALASVALQAPANLRIIVLDNERYGETGGQASHTAGSVDLAAVGRGCGLAATTIRLPGELEAFAPRVVDPGAGTELAIIKISPEEYPRVLPSRDGGLLKARLRHAIGLEPIGFAI